MRFFSRRDNANHPNDQTNVQHRNRRKIMGRHERNSESSRHHSLGKRPSFGQWLKLCWLDILSFVVIGAIGLGVYFADPAPSRSFPVYFQDGEVVFPEFAYPLRTEIVPIWLAALLAVSVPILIILLMQIRIRSFWDANNGVFALLYAVISAAVFQVFLKWLIGGLRPHFLDVCKPDIPVGVAPSGSGFGHIMYQRNICTGDKNDIDDSLESFPSGHSTAAFAGFIYLYLYLNGKLKVWSNRHTSYWKLVVTYMPVLGATLIAGSLTIDEFHNWYDILAGATIGTTFAFSAYRMVYASVWDFRFNHIPLTRAEGFAYETSVTSNKEFNDPAWDRHEGPSNAGAPFDAASTSRVGHDLSHTPHARSSDGQDEHRHYGSGHHRTEPASFGRKPVPPPKERLGDQMV